MSDQDAVWQQLCGRFHAWTGMILPSTMRPRAMSALRTLATLDRSTEPLAYLAQLDQLPAQRQPLLDAVGLGTTWFMRDASALEALVAALRSAAGPRGSARLWSIGCSTGEEPYSLAMLLDQAGVSCRILATDINRVALRRASEGRYPVADIARVDAALRERYFVPDGSHAVRVAAKIRDRVQFTLHNLAAADEVPVGWPPLDALVCRNVLIYFDRDVALGMITRLAAHCRPGGYLLLGAVERPLLWMSDLAVRTNTPTLVSLSPQESAAFKSERTIMSRLASPAAGAAGIRARVRSKTKEELIAPLMEDASALQRSGRLVEALATLDTAAELAQLAAAVHTARGIVLKDLGRYPAAIDAFRAACFFDEHAWLAPYELGFCLEVQGEPREAYEAYRHALGALEGGAPPGLDRAWGDVAELATTAMETCRRHIGRCRERYGD